MNNLILFFLNFPLLLSSIFCYGNLLEMGKGSYGNPGIAHWGEEAVCRVGNYCSIAVGVTIFLGGEHRPDWVTTYPFSVFLKEAQGIPGHPRTKGDVIIGNDVWIAQGATILSGVTIGDGAVIGAQAVVAKDVPPYAIVVGNPARVVKYRFTPKQIKQLLSIAWWNWSEQEIIDAIPLLLNTDIDLFIKYCKYKKI